MSRINIFIVFTVILSIANCFNVVKYKNYEKLSIRLVNKFVSNRLNHLYQSDVDESIPIKDKQIEDDIFDEDGGIPIVNEDINDDEIEKLLESINFNNTNNNITTTIELNPLEQAIKNKEIELQNELNRYENILRYERQTLSKVKDKVSESGKMGFFMIQAQVTDFQRKKDIEQKNLVKKSKRDFVNKLLPIIDSFREARDLAPPSTEREENMHKNFGSLLSSILLVLEKSGFKEYRAEIGSKIDSKLHKISSIQDGEEDGIILKEVKPGIIYNNEDIIRPSFVISSKKQIQKVVVEEKDIAIPIIDDGNSSKDNNLQ